MTWVTQQDAALLTDLYELTMADSYHRAGMTDEATFDLFVRHLPGRRNFLIACGLEEALDYLENLRFSDESVAYLDSLGLFSDSFLDFLTTLTFTGTVWAIPEGEVAFAAEPLLRVAAPLVEAQIVESFLLNCIAFQTMVASKAARMTIACQGKSFVEMSLRRAHGTDAAHKAARAAYVGGAAATSNVLAGRLYGLPVMGTMAHSYVMAFDDELRAFRTFAGHFPGRAVLLIDTFDTEEGARRAVQVARELARSGRKLQGVRLDSGDVALLSRSVRKILDHDGFNDVKIVVSGDLDEYQIRELIEQDAPIDSFGVGTQLGTSADEPFLGAVYKLVVQGGRAKIKLSTGKLTIPGSKQVFRVPAQGRYHHDVMALEHERVDDGRPLLEEVMSGGRRVADSQPLEALQNRCRNALEGLPDPLQSLVERAEYPVHYSKELSSLIAQARSALGRPAQGSSPA
jgi:nicotinate phosphoribosyltransferase